MEFKLFVSPGLGDNSYLLISGDEAVLVDPQRERSRDETPEGLNDQRQ